MLKRIRNWDGPVILCHQCDQWISESKWHEHHLPGGCPCRDKEDEYDDQGDESVMHK